MGASAGLRDGTVRGQNFMKETLPRVSVITPAYNRASLVEQTILSVLSQDYPNLEYIVLDDGSEDGTLEVIRKYEDRLRWDRHANMGETRTVNKGFSMAEGDIIGILSSDDPLLPGAVSKAVKLLVDKPEVVVVYPDWRMIDAEGRLVQAITARDFVSAADMVRRHHCLPGPGAFFRREVVETLGGRDERLRYRGDLEFYFRAALLGPFERIPETLAEFRTHSGSGTLCHQGAQMAEEHVRVLDQFYARRDLPASVTQVKREAYSSAYYMAGCCCGGRPLLKAKYFSRAILCAPLKYLGEYMPRLAMMLLVLLGMSNVRTDLFLRRLAKPFTPSRRSDGEAPSAKSREPRSTADPRERPANSALTEHDSNSTDAERMTSAGT